NTIAPHVNTSANGRARWYTNFGAPVEIHRPIILHEDGGVRKRTDPIAIFGNVQKCNQLASAPNKRKSLRSKSRRASSGPKRSGRLSSHSHLVVLQGRRQAD